MAANVVVITDPAKWEIIREVLCELDEGGIVVGPVAAAAYETKFGQPIDESYIEDYDFDGADIWVDWTDDPALGHRAIHALSAEGDDDEPGDDSAEGTD